MQSKIIVLTVVSLFNFKLMAEDSLGGTLTYKDKSGATGSLRVACAKRNKDGSCLRFNVNGTNESVNESFLKYSCNENKMLLNSNKVFFVDEKRQSNRLSFSQAVYKSELQSNLNRCNLSITTKLKNKFGNKSAKAYIGLPVDIVKLPVCLAINNKVFRTDKTVKKSFLHLFNEANIGQEKEISRTEWSALLCGLTLK